MKGNRLLTLVISLSLTLVLAMLLLPACAAEEPAPTPTPTPVEYKWPDSMIIETVGVGGGGHTLAISWGPVMEKLTGMKVRIVPTDMVAQRLQNFVDKKNDFITESIADMSQYITGGGGNVATPKTALRILWHANDTPWGWAVLGNSPLETIYDIKEKKGIKVSLNTTSPAMVETTEKGLPAFLDIPPEDITFVPIGGYSASCKSIVEGKAEVALVSPMSTVTQEMEANPRGLKWLDMPLEDEEAWTRFLPHRLGIPSEITWGVKSAIGHYGYTSNYLYFVRGDQDQELTYQLAKWYNENFDAYKDNDPKCARMSLKQFRSFLDFTPYPVAEGTIRYLKEIGKWTADDDARNERTIKQTEAYIEAWKAASAEAKSKGIKIAADNQEWIDLWGSHTKTLPRFQVQVD